MKLETLSRDYLAGFFDGEGTITIIKRKKTRNSKNQPSYIPRVSITQKNPFVLELLKEECGGTLFSYKEKKSGRTYYKWAMDGFNIDEFIGLIWPYSFLKRSLLLKVLEFINWRKTQPWTHVGKDFVKICQSYHTIVASMQEREKKHGAKKLEVDTTTK